jgi:hydrogenase maturation factor
MPKLARVTKKQGLEAAVILNSAGRDGLERYLAWELARNGNDLYAEFEPQRKAWERRLQDALDRQAKEMK